MKVDISFGGDPRTAASRARRAESARYDGVGIGETAHDPLIACALAARATSRIDVATSIAVAFARSPMTLATAANDLQLLTEGRFVLGLGSQIRAHITRRFSMPWSQPAARMREFVLAMRAIWHAWHEGVDLDFTGDFYTHTLMTPVFDPGPNPYGRPRVQLAAVGTAMTAVAGEVADGFLAHGFTTAEYLRQVSLPALAAGRAKGGASMAGFDVSGVPFIVTGTTEAEMREASQGVREQIAFYASTPAYRPVLETHGWGELQTELHALSRAGRWTDMARCIEPEVLATFAVVAEPHDVADALRERFGELLTRVKLTLSVPLPDEVEASIVEGLQR